MTNLTQPPLCSSPFHVYLPSHGLPPLRAQIPIPWSHHFSTNVLFFVKMLYKLQVLTQFELHILEFLPGA